MALNQNYYHLWFKSFHLENTSGHRDDVQLSLVPNQKIPDEIMKECDSRSVDPYVLLTGYDKDLFYEYPVGTRFKLKAKLNDRKGKGMFFYTSYWWSPLEIIEP